MRKLDQRGVAAFEFTLAAALFFTIVFTIFDLGRYVITMQSLRTLANAGARANMISCYTPAVTSNSSPSACTGSYLSSTQMQDAAPFLYYGGLTPTLSTTSASSMLTVTASQPQFSMMMPIWGSALNAPSATAEIPY